MPGSPERSPLGWRSRVTVLAVVALGFALTLVVFYPGVLNFDARYVHSYVASGHYGDWQSPVLTVLWGLIDPIAPGSASMFLLIAIVYWLAFAILALAIARRSLLCAILLPLLALTPPAFALVGMVWRDVLFANAWLLAAATVFATADGSKGTRLAAQAIAIMLLGFGVLLRPNALLAAPLLAAYIFWPTAFSWKRAAALYLPAAIASLALVQVVYYGLLGATREHPEQSIMVFDLAGISHFTGENQFPGTWTPEESARLIGPCYQPVEWDGYWTHDCIFVMQRLDHDKIFGSPQLVKAWLQAVRHHPIAYSQHRLAFMWNFLSAENRVMFTRDLDDPNKTVMIGNPAFMTFKAIHDALLPTPVFRGGVWIALCAVLCVVGWRRRESEAGGFALGVCGSAVVYVMSFLVIGVASDFRYVYWAVLAGFAGLTVIVAPSYSVASASSGAAMEGESADMNCALASAAKRPPRR